MKKIEVRINKKEKKVKGQHKRLSVILVFTLLQKYSAVEKDKQFTAVVRLYV